ncbi:MAG: ABC transporter permease [Oscillospiraceae bacterium]|jgi:simple sugar transport system permease protein|nr:ABC transporter permease [Oscillospiraceae bacterium]
MIRIVKRPEAGRRRNLLIWAGAFVLALLAGAAFLALLGQKPWEIYGMILKGAFVGSRRNPLSAIQATIVKFVPLLLVSLGLTLAFQMRFWNIGGEGQMILGAIAASAFALYTPNLPQPLLAILMLLAGCAAGGLWALLPAVCKVRLGVNETLFTLMMNYVALYLVAYLQSGPWQRTPGFASVGSFSENIRLPKLFGVHIGWLLALALTALIWAYLRHTKQGYELRVAGESQTTARYAGMRVGRIVLRTMFFSGAVCGLAGMIQVAGIDYTLSTGVTGGVGFTGITLAWLAQLNPPAIALAAAVFSILEKGSSSIPPDIMAAEAAQVLQSILLFSFLICEFFRRYAIRWRAAKP